MSEHFITVHRTDDPVELEMLEDLLRQEGLRARGIGTRHGALIGVAQAVLALRIEVPEHQADRARELVTVALGGDAAEGEASARGPRARLAPQPGLGHLSPLIAAGVVLVFPGACHLYARRPRRAAVIAALEIVGFVGLLQGAWPGKIAGLLLLLGGLLWDLVGAQALVRRHNAGLKQSCGARARYQNTCRRRFRPSAISASRRDLTSSMRPCSVSSSSSGSPSPKKMGSPKCSR